jgi:hypothetical protein
MTAVATVIFLATKFTSGAWVVVIAIPALLVLFSRIARYYADVGRELGTNRVPGEPRAEKSLVVVAVSGVSRMTEFALNTALSLSDEVVAVSVQFDDDRAEALQAAWDRWRPGVRLDVLRSPSRSIVTPMVGYLGSPEVRAHHQVLVLIPEVEPRKWRHQLLQNQRGVILANVLRRRCYVNVLRVPFRLTQD